MYNIKAQSIRTRLDNMLKDHSKSDRENIVELWAIVSDIQLWLADQEEKAKQGLAAY